jgi:DHA3 family macrolide efflux protein-like MFS transporter
MALLPGVIFGPLAGVLVDRWPRRLIIMGADGVAAIGAAILMILFWTGEIQVWHIYAITFVRSIAGTFQFAAVQASTTLMVPPEQLARRRHEPNGAGHQYAGSASFGCIAFGVVFAAMDDGN